MTRSRRGPAHRPRRAAPRVGAHSRARSRETVSGSGPKPGCKQGGALCPPAPGLAEARGRGGGAAVARARARAPARPASSVFVLMEPACSWRVSSHVPRPRRGWALAAETRGRAREGSQTLNSPETTLRYSLVVLGAVGPLEQDLYSSSQHPCQSASHPPHPGPEDQPRDRTDLTGVLSLAPEVPTSGFSSRLHGVIKPRALK